MLSWMRQPNRFHPAIAGSLVFLGYVGLLAAACGLIAFAAPKIVLSAIAELQAEDGVHSGLQVGEARPQQVMPEPYRAARYVPTDDFLESLESPKFWKSRGRSAALFDLFDDDEDKEDEFTTFRTMCVRLCDGYYWPVSFSTSPERFGRDAQVCQSSCAAPTRLFVYGNPGGSLDHMKDLKGRPYSRLPAASMFKTSYNPNCSCKAQPWHQASKNRHRMYALAKKKRRTRGRSARRKVASELRSLRRLVRLQERDFRREARKAAKIELAKASGKPVAVTRLVAKTSKPHGAIQPATLKKPAVPVAAKVRSLPRVAKVDAVKPVKQKAPSVSLKPVRVKIVNRPGRQKTAKVTAGKVSSGQPKPSAAPQVTLRPTIVTSRRRGIEAPMGLGARVPEQTVKKVVRPRRAVRRSARRSSWKRSAFGSSSAE